MLRWNYWCFLGGSTSSSSTSGQADGRNTGYQAESFGSPNGSSEKSGVHFPSIPAAVDDGKLMIARHVTYISKLILHPSKVLEVQVKKENINPKAGQYIFISCPEISFLQYHPFTLTSAPEEDYVSVHMRIVGDWTSVCLSASFFLSFFLSSLLISCFPLSTHCFLLSLLSSFSSIPNPSDRIESLMIGIRKSCGSGY